MPAMPEPVTASVSVDLIYLLKNDRSYEDDEEQRELTQSIKDKGLLHPPLVNKEGGRYGLFAGNRRFWAFKALGRTEIPCRVYEGISPQQIRTLHAAENLQRKDLTDPQTYSLCMGMLADNPDWNRRDLATEVNKSASWVTQVLSVDKLIPEGKAAFMDGKFGFSKSYQLSKLSHEDQPAMLASLLGGATRRQMERGRHRAKPSEKVGSIKVILDEGVTVIVKGKDLDLESAATYAQAAGKRFDKAIRDQHDVRSFGSLMAKISRAKAGD